MLNSSLPQRLSPSLSSTLSPKLTAISSHSRKPFISPSFSLPLFNCTAGVDAARTILKFGFVNKTRLFPTRVSFLELPLLPFPKEEVLVPCETKTIYLFEARYLALLEESLFQKNNLFVHFVLDPIAFNDTATEASFAARYGCLVVIEKVEQLEVGALVSIRGIGRVKIIQFEQAEPYLRGGVTPVFDKANNAAEAISKISELKEALYSLNSLEIKLKSPKEAPLQTQTINSLNWAEKTSHINCDEAFVPPVAERVSFAAFQTISGSTRLELLNLQKEKLGAMDLKDTVERLQKSIELVKSNISLVAAKLAIQSLEIL